jgi:hypothetical protein
MCALISFHNMFSKKYFHKYFSYFRKNSRDRKGTSLVSFLSLKIMGYYPRFMNIFVAILSHKTPLGYDQSPIQTFYIMICYIWLGDSASSRTPNNRGIILTIIHLAIRLYHFCKITLDQKFILLLSEWFQSTISTWISWLFSWWSKLGP